MQMRRAVCALVLGGLAVATPVAGIDDVTCDGALDRAHDRVNSGVAADEQGLEQGGSMALVQKMLAYRKREVRLGWLNETVREARPALSRHAFGRKVSPCLRERDVEGTLPLTPGVRFQVEAIRELGMLGSEDHCTPTQSVSFVATYITPYMAMDASSHNQTARMLIMVWTVGVVIVILWSVAAVAVVPRKRAWESSTPRSMNLADEEGAFRIGIFNWLSLSWADGLVGRYGKCLHANVDACEFGVDEQKLETMPHRMFKKHWEEQLQTKGFANASLVAALYKTIGFKACFLMVITVIFEMSLQMMGMVVALDTLLSYLEKMNAMRQENPELPVSYLEPSVMVIALIWGVPMAFRGASIMVSLLDGYYTNVCASGLASVVFEKAMNLPAGASTQEDQEKAGVEDPTMKPNIVQILNVDIIEAWAYLLKIVVYTAVAPIMLCILFGMLINQIHLAGVVGLSYVVPCLLVTLLGFAFNLNEWKKYQGFQDSRLAYLTETMQHIRMIKSLAWEKLMYKKLHDTRRSELECNQRCTVLGGFLTGMTHTMPFGTMMCAMFFLTLTQGSVKAHQIIVIQRIMASLLGAIGVIMGGIGKLVAVPQSFRRIRSFLAQPERPKNLVRQPALEDAVASASALRLCGSFTFVQGKPPSLKDLDLGINRGELVGVVGGLASGKSALLQAMIGELYPVKGAYLERPGAPDAPMAYCAQVPWIFEGTLRDNVILDKALEQDRYHSCLQAAALTPDLQILPGGDQVSIGSQGVRLSGGQRARVALARAAYMQADVVVADDPFASLDVPTGLHILKELIHGPLMADRTRIVATQPSPSRLQKFDRLILMEAGVVVENGRPEDVMASEGFQRLLATEDLAAERLPAGTPTGVETENQVTSFQKKAGEEATSLRDIEVVDHVTWETLIWWLQAAGICNLFLFVFMVGLQRIGGLFETVAIASWIDVKMEHEVNDGEYLFRLAVVVAVVCVIITVAAWAGSRVSISASEKIHASVMQSLLQAPIDRFFDKQPIGRLINRLSFDLRQVDDAVGAVIVSLMSFLLGMCVTQVYIWYNLVWQINLMSIPFFFIMLFFMYLYRGTAVPLVFHTKFELSSIQDLQAAVSTSCVSIRAAGMNGYFMHKYNRCAANIIRSQYLVYHVCKAWVQSRVFLVYGSLSCMFVLSSLWLDVPMGTLATIIALSFAQMSEFEQVATSFTQLLSVLNALQRLTRYFSIPQEAAHQLASDVRIRARVLIQRAELAPLELRRALGGDDKGDVPASAAKVWEGPIMVCLKGKFPVLKATLDNNLALDLMHSRRLRDLAPSSEALKGLGDETYHIVGVNSVTQSAELMAEEMCSASTSLWLDLWHSNYANGVRVKFDDLTAGYGMDKNVLNCITVDIAPRMKVGVAGTTGCGKSTLLLCILRILEPRRGRVMLGDMDTSKIGLQNLRSMVGLVSQDPTVFEGTWRYNIDPFEEYPDACIWEAIRAVQLMGIVRSLPRGIDAQITKDGGNLSFGQRQLLSLARMVIRQPPVLLLDECTSALDPATQEAVQNTLLNAFPMSTTIAVAHRVETILGFDQVVVLDAGKVAEKGSVKEVLEIPDGIFARMVKAHKS